MADRHEYREGYRGSRKVTADAVVAELEKLGPDGITAGRVVKAATPKDAPLHSLFTWDDKVAGHKYRLIEARTVIRAIVVNPGPEDEGGKAPTSLYVHVPDANEAEGKYTHLSVVAENIDEYARALMEAQRHLDAAERRLHELRRLAQARGGKEEALALAVQAFSAVRQAMELLK